MSDDELDMKDSMVMNRAKRSNAGNRLKSLLENEELLEDDENGIFIEFEEDDDFEIKPETDEEGDEEEDDDDNEQEQEVGDEDNETTKLSKRKPEEDDENFSSESDDQSSDEDEDEGEKQLQKEQKAERRNKTKSKKTAPLIKKVKIDDADEEQRRKKRERDAERQANMSKQLLSNARRSSKRESAIKNKQEVIERLQESEARRAQYVAPVVKETRKITQEELLAEAEITERKNRASLRFYVEQEELRKQRQRAAMLAKRAPMTKFIRWSSKTTIIPPRRIFGRQPIELVMAQFGTGEVKNEEAGGETKEKENNDNDMNKTYETFNGKEQDSKNNENETFDENDMDSNMSKIESEMQDDENSALSIAGVEEIHVVEQEKTDEQKETHKNDEEKDSQELNVDAEKNEDDLSKESNDITEKPSGHDDSTQLPSIKEEPSENNDSVNEPSEDASNKTTLVYGPSACRARGLVTLMGFTDGYELPSNRAKQILLGFQSMRTASPPDKRLQCVISGQPAVYVDPQTKIPYSSLQAYKVIGMVEQGKMAWNTSLGGVYTGLLNRNQRHATGVPREFYR